MTQAESSVKSADGRLPPLRQCPNVTVHSQSVRRLPPPYWIGSRLNLSDLLYKTYIKFFLKKHTCKWRRWWTRKVPRRKIIEGSSVHAAWRRGERRTSSHVRAPYIHWEQWASDRRNKARASCFTFGGKRCIRHI